MRRALLVCGIFAVIGCGIDAVATNAGPVAEGPDTSTGPGLDSSMPPDPPDVLVDAPVLDTGVDAEAMRPDAGIAFVPSHLGPTDYSLSDTAVSISNDSTINTTTLSIMGAGTVPPLVAINSSIAVWSVGALTTNAHITVVGSRALVIVAHGDVSLKGTMSANATTTDGDNPALPGPGGFLDALGSFNGLSPLGMGGGGGAGGGQGGAAGGSKNGSGMNGGAGGAMDNLLGMMLVGGSGGGNAGGYVAPAAGSNAATCARGGYGGGAIQISTTGMISFSQNGSTIDVSGGGGMGGCGNGVSGGGGGGAGGIIYLETVAGIDLPNGSTVVASGGAGGEGGDDHDNDGNPGGMGNDGNPIARGGQGNAANGGNGGDGGGVASRGATATAPGNGNNNDATGGGGGGGMGQVFFRTRAGSTISLDGAVYATSTTDMTF